MDISENLVKLHMLNMIYIFGLFAISIRRILGYNVDFKQSLDLKIFNLLIESS